MPLNVSSAFKIVTWRRYPSLLVNAVVDALVMGDDPLTDSVSDIWGSVCPSHRPVSDTLCSHLKTLYLFTKSDIKTILFPVTVFASVAAPMRSPISLLQVMPWIWLHLLQANVSNQCWSSSEDAINKPHRPIPSGRVTASQARLLRWCLLAPCLLLSALYSPWVALASAALTVVEIVHDDLGFCGHPVLKNLCNVGGYMTFQIGATVAVSHTRTLDSIAVLALLCSAVVIFTTIHAQDFADVAGDQAAGRQTLPIIAPNGSRIYISTSLVLSSIALSWVWNLGKLSASLFMVGGATLGVRFFRQRDAQQDRLSYVFYNVWLAVALVLPIRARTSLLAW